METRVPAPVPAYYNYNLRAIRRNNRLALQVVCNVNMRGDESTGGSRRAPIVYGAAT